MDATTVETACWSGLEELGGALRSHLVVRCRDEGELEDLVQETLLRAARYRPSLADEHRLRPWLLRIAGNVWRDHVRRERRLPRQELEEEELLALEARADASEDRSWALLDEHGCSWDREEVLLDLSRVRERLRDDERAVLDSYYGGAQSCLASARALGLTHGQAKVRLFRARRRVAEGLRRLLELRRRRLRPGPLASPLTGPLAGRAPALLALLLGLLGTGAPALAAPSREPPAHEDARSGASCPEARELRRRAWGARLAIAAAGPRAAQARAAAVEAWHELARRCPEPSVVAESAFRAAELWRAGGELESARRELARARAAGETLFRPRAGLLLGDLERQAGAQRAALAAYEDVLLDRASRPWERERALVGMGSAQAELGRPAEARRLWLRVVEPRARGEGDALEQARAFDLLASQCVALRDAAGAAGWLEAARRALGPIARERTRRGARVRSALERMRTPRALAHLLAREAGVRPEPTPPPSEPDE